MRKLTPYQYSILHIVSLGHGKITLHGVSVVAGIGDTPDETSLPTLLRLAEMGLVDQTLPGKSSNQWSITELGKQVLAERGSNLPDNAEDETE